MLDLLFLVVGLPLLVYGGDWLVDNASRLALLLRISPTVVGLTVVAAGTSAPELVVSLSAAFEGVPDVSVGNVVGSNIYNLALVLGITALIHPLDVQKSTIRFDWPVLAVATLALIAITQDLELSRAEGIGLSLALAIYVTWTVVQAMREPEAQSPSQYAEDIDAAGGRSKALFSASMWSLIGIVAVVAGARFFVEGAVGIAHWAGISERVIGLTLVAFGTSLPELVTSAIAAVKGKDDIAIANCIGSSIFNILCIIGFTATIVPIPVNPNTVSWDQWWLLGGTVGLFVFMRTQMRVDRWEGGVMVAFALIFTGTLF